MNADCACFIKCVKHFICVDCRFAPTNNMPTRGYMYAEIEAKTHYMGVTSK